MELKQKVGVLNIVLFQWFERTHLFFDIRTHTVTLT